MFTGFSDETIQFFLDIRFHNSVEYYNENKERFVQHVQQPFYALIADLVPTMQEIDPQMEIRPYRCLARLRRDIRFSKDKSPYKDHLWFTFRRAAEPREGSLGFWFGMGPDWLEWGMGFWGQNKPVLERFRREMAAHPDRVRAIIDSCDLAANRLVMAGDMPKRYTVPDTIPPELIPWYATKDLYVRTASYTLQEAGSEAIFHRLQNDFTHLAPLYRMLRGIQDDILQEERLAQQQNAPATRVDEW